MSNTVHAQMRMQHRGIPPLIVEWLLEYGASERAHGAVKRYFDKSSRRRLGNRYGRQVIDRMGDLLNIYIVESDGTVITAAHRTKRFKSI